LRVLGIQVFPCRVDCLIISLEFRCASSTPTKTSSSLKIQHITFCAILTRNPPDAFIALLSLRRTKYSSTTKKEENECICESARTSNFGCTTACNLEITWYRCFIYCENSSIHLVLFVNVYLLISSVANTQAYKRYIERICTHTCISATMT